MYFGYLVLMRVILSVVLSFMLLSLGAQTWGDSVIKESIGAVTWTVAGGAAEMPIVQLGQPIPLILTFDDITETVENYGYRIIHCNKNWKSSELSDLDFIDGFNDGTIEDFEFSFNTTVDYVHYEIAFPNDDIQWLLSGNYVLVVYENGDIEDVVLSRRFMVVDPVFSIDARSLTPRNVKYSQTHQEIEFAVEHEGVALENPRSTVTAVLLQNGRWDNAIIGIEPLFVKPERMLFDYRDKLLFPAGKEFRFVDIRSFRFKADGVYKLEDRDEGYDVTLFIDPDRRKLGYQFIEDANGGFIIDNIHERDDAVQGDYGYVTFSVQAEQPFPEGHDVYLLGQMNNWQPNESYKMEFNNRHSVYETTVRLKQGFYEYAYGLQTPDSNGFLTSTFDGDWYDTENSYTILVYYTPFGSQYDQLLGVQTIRSR